LQAPASGALCAACESHDQSASEGSGRARRITRPLPAFEPKALTDHDGICCSCSEHAAASFAHNLPTSNVTPLKIQTDERA
jgi:hypothetical protein